MKNSVKYIFFGLIVLFSPLTLASSYFVDDEEKGYMGWEELARESIRESLWIKCDSPTSLGLKEFYQCLGPEEAERLQKELRPNINDLYDLLEQNRDFQKAIKEAVAEVVVRNIYGEVYKLLSKNLLVNMYETLICHLDDTECLVIDSKNDNHSENNKEEESIQV